jgi:precorrin-8X/cobalt-precorrin-8 methylmutase
MPLFDFYLMVDWSGAAHRRGHRADAIWVAFGRVLDEIPKTVSPFSRSEAIQLVRELLETQLSEGHRTLVCFDFAYAFPSDFSAALQVATGTPDNVLPWLSVWQYLRDQIRDDDESPVARKPSNRNNRFEIANKVNSLLSLGSDSAGPFWCAPSEGSYPYIPQNQPPQPFQTAQGFAMPARRFTDMRAKSGSPFRLFGHGSVGSQTLTGIPRLHELRFAPEFSRRSVVWPFETGWATKAAWLSQETRIVHAENLSKRHHTCRRFDQGPWSGACHVGLGA